MRSRAVGTPVALLVALTVALTAAVTAAPSAESAGPSLGPPEDVHTTVVGGQKAIAVSWSPPTSGVPIGLAYDVLLDGQVVGTTALQTSYVIADDSLQVGVGN